MNDTDNTCFRNIVMFFFFVTVSSSHKYSVAIPLEWNGIGNSTGLKKNKKFLFIDIRIMNELYWFTLISCELY